jgi:hypothetical protein
LPDFVAWYIRKKRWRLQDLFSLFVAVPSITREQWKCMVV